MTPCGIVPLLANKGMMTDATTPPEGGVDKVTRTRATPHRSVRRWGIVVSWVSSPKTALTRLASFTLALAVFA